MISRKPCSTHSPPFNHSWRPKSHHMLNVEIRVNVPLIGGKLEKLLAEDLQLKFKHDTEVALALVTAN